MSMSIKKHGLARSVYLKFQFHAVDLYSLHASSLLVGIGVLKRDA